MTVHPPSELLQRLSHTNREPAILKTAAAEDDIGTRLCGCHSSRPFHERVVKPCRHDTRRTALRTGTEAEAVAFTGRGGNSSTRCIGPLRSFEIIARSSTHVRSRIRDSVSDRSPPSEIPNSKRFACNPESGLKRPRPRGRNRQRGDTVFNPSRTMVKNQGVIHINEIVHLILQ